MLQLVRFGFSFYSQSRSQAKAGVHHCNRAVPSSDARRFSVIDTISPPAEDDFGM